MPEDAPRQPIDPKGNNGEVPPSPPAPSLPDPPKATTYEHPSPEAAKAHTNDDVKAEIQSVKDKIDDRIRTAEKWMLIFTGVIAAFTVGLVVVGVLQWNAMRGQLKEMHDGGVDTHDLAVAAQEQAAAANLQSQRTESLATTAGVQATAALGQVEKLGALANATEVLAGQAAIQAGSGKQLAQNATDTLRNTQRAFQDEQRAWVGVQQTISGEFTETKPWGVTVSFLNSGRTAARNVQVSAMFRTSPVALSSPPPDDIKELKFRPAQSIAPQGRYLLVIGKDAASEPVSSTQRQGMQALISLYQPIKNMTILLYYFGVLKYDDIFGNPWETQFCIMLANPDTREVGFCDGFNDLK